MLGRATAQEVYFKAVEMIDNSKQQNTQKRKKMKIGKGKETEGNGSRLEKRNQKAGKMRKRGKKKRVIKNIYEREREYMMGI